MQQLERYQHTLQRNWRPARLQQSVTRFWSNHTRLWQWLFTESGIHDLSDIRRQHIFDYLDHRLAGGYAVSTINQDLRYFRAFLRFLQEQDFAIPQTLLRIKGLKQPDRLPRFLTDSQVQALRADLEEQVTLAPSTPQRRDALLDRATFYLLWHGGLRVGEVEELRRPDVDLPGRRLTVREGKGLQDRTVYLTASAVQAVQEYLAVRGPGLSDHVFLYRNAPLCKDLVRDRLHAAGDRAGVKVTPHRLRHTFATQLLNAGCQITTIQKLLGHRQLSSTLVYARVYDRTVAEDYYAAMALVEQRLDAGMPDEVDANTNLVKIAERDTLLKLVDTLATPQLDDVTRLNLVAQLRELVRIQPVRPAKT